MIAVLAAVLNQHCRCHFLPLWMWRRPSQQGSVLSSAHTQCSNHIGVHRVVHWPVVLVRTHHVCKSDNVIKINAWKKNNNNTMVTMKTTIAKTTRQNETETHPLEHCAYDMGEKRGRKKERGRERGREGERKREREKEREREREKVYL